MKRLPPKEPEERIVVAFEFKRQLGDGVTLVSPAVVSTLLSGVDASPGAVISGSAAVLGTKILQMTKDGVVGADYRLKCQVDTSDGQRFTLSARLPVR